MRFMMIMYPGPGAEAGKLPTTEDMERMGRFNEELVKAGVLLAGEGLHPTSKGARVRFSGGKATLTDGPFTESKEIVGGFWMIQVKSPEEAWAWARKIPGGDEDMVELRRVFEMEDFGPAMTPELQAQEERMRAEIEAKK